MGNSKKLQLTQKIVIVKEEDLNERIPRSQRIIYGWTGYVALHKFFSDIYEKENGKDTMLREIGYFRSRLMLNKKILNDLNSRIKDLRTESEVDCPFEIGDEYFESSRTFSEAIPIIRQNMEEKSDHLMYYIGFWK
tara:strand:+ start:156 stop:563 length:408 start_codon:yes stop_codon:yes gene_type:complete